jgi:catechol 2,3-dioxygenase-like lactoylglutathione lyase family enzyme
MYSHIMVGTNDLDRAKAFYDATFGALDVAPGTVDRHRIVYWTPTGGIFWVSKPIDGKRATPANGGTIGFLCSSPEQADAWHAAGVANGGVSCEDPPGVRQGFVGQHYLAYLRDPDGNKLCALYRITPAQAS